MTRIIELPKIPEIDEIPDSSLLEMSADMRADYLEGYDDLIETLRINLEIAERDKQRLEGVPTTDDYTRAYERIKDGEHPTKVREDFQAIYTTVSNDAFTQRMSRRRKWEKKREKENFKG